MENIITALRCNQPYMHILHTIDLPMTVIHGNSGVQQYLNDAVHEWHLAPQTTNCVEKWPRYANINFAC